MSSAAPEQKNARMTTHLGANTPPFFFAAALRGLGCGFFPLGVIVFNTLSLWQERTHHDHQLEGRHEVRVTCSRVGRSVA
jgi:hypothetical protein